MESTAILTGSTEAHDNKHCGDKATMKATEFMIWKYI